MNSSKSSIGRCDKSVYASPVYPAILRKNSLKAWVHWLYENDPDLELP